MGAGGGNLSGEGQPAAGGQPDRNAQLEVEEGGNEVPAGTTGGGQPGGLAVEGENAGGSGNSDTEPAGQQPVSEAAELLPAIEADGPLKVEQKDVKRLSFFGDDQAHGATLRLPPWQAIGRALLGVGVSCVVDRCLYFIAA